MFSSRLHASKCQVECHGRSTLSSCSFFFHSSVPFSMSFLLLRRSALHALEQHVTSSQHRSHFFRHIKGRPQTTHVLLGKSCFLTTFFLGWLPPPRRPCNRVKANRFAKLSRLGTTGNDGRVTKACTSVSCANIKSPPKENQVHCA